MTELLESDPRSAIYVDLNTMTVLTLGGDTLPITNMIDAGGDECIDPDEAVVVVAGSEALGWYTVPLPWADEDNETIH